MKNYQERSPLLFLHSKSEASMYVPFVPLTIGLSGAAGVLPVEYYVAA